MCAHADPDEVLVSRTVTDPVAGSDIEFQDRREHKLNGVPGDRRLSAVNPPQPGTGHLARLGNPQFDSPERPAIPRISIRRTLCRERAHLR
jgi:hypothetical protein